VFIAIDATNIGSGGGITHLIEFLTCFKNLHSNNRKNDISIFSCQKVLDQIPTSKFINKYTHPNLNKSIFHRIIFQLFQFDNLLINKYDILFSITGDYLGKFKPVVGMSRNMLLYERDIWKEIKQPKEIMRFWLNFQKQKHCFNNASGIIFISEYAKMEVSKPINLKNKYLTTIHHGVSPRFTGKVQPQNPISSFSIETPFRFLYVSTVHVYKHQWNVIEAIGNLRKKGYPVELDLVGGVIFPPAGKILVESINKVDSQQNFIHYHGHVPYEEIDALYKKADGIIYASTCENMPAILIESMASGIPIACSNKQPMPEFLKENGFYFNAKDVDSIEKTLEQFLSQPNEREKMALNNLEEVKRYSWQKTTEETLQFITDIYNSFSI